MRRTSRNLTVAILALAGFFVMGLLGWLSPVTSPITRALTTVAGPFYRAGSTFSRMREAALYDALPEDAMDRLITENAKLHSLSAENEALKDAVDYRERFTEDLLLARVVSPVSDASFFGLIIDRGADDGVRVGQPVITGDGIMVGKILSVRAQTSAILLLSDSRSRLAVAVQNETNTIGVLEGDRGIAMTISLVPISEQLAPGKTIITSGLEPGIRRGLVVGTIDSVSRNAQDPYQTAAVTPFKSAAHPIFVQILVSPEFGISGKK